MATGSVYNNHNNTITLNLTENNVAANLSGMTKVTVTINNTTIDSSVTPAAFDLTGIATGIIKLKFGGQGVPEGTYNARVVVYDATNTIGIVWVHEDDDTKLSIKVVTD